MEKDEKKKYWDRRKKKILESLQREGDKSPKVFRGTAGMYEEGYWDGLKFAAFLVNEMKP